MSDRKPIQLPPSSDELAERLAYRFVDLCKLASAVTGSIIIGHEFGWHIGLAAALLAWAAKSI